MKREFIWDRLRLAKPRNNGFFYRNIKIIGRKIAKKKGWRVIGLENIPKEGPFIMDLNHVSFIDAIIAFFMSDRDVFPMAKNEFFYPTIESLGLAQYKAAKYFGWLLPLLGVFPIKRGKPDRKNLSVGIKIIKQGHGVLVFPEGGISKTGKLESQARGSVYLAQQTGAPIYVAYLIGTGAKRDNYQEYSGPPILIFGKRSIFAKDTTREERRKTSIEVQVYMDEIAEEFWSKNCKKIKP